jgi:hypothetical protein
MPKVEFEGSTTTKITNATVEDHEETVEQVDLSDGQERAKAEKQGWRPKDEYHGDPDKWVDFDEFNRRGDKIASIAASRAERLQKQVAELQNTLVTVNENYQKINARERLQAKATIDTMTTRISQLEAARADAISASDGQAAVRIEKQIVQAHAAVEGAKEVVAEADAQTTTAKIQQEGGQKLPPQAVDWRAKNEWYGIDAEATIYADGMAAFYLKSNQGASLEDMFEYVDKKVSSRFAEYSNVNNTTRKKPAGPESGNSGIRTSGTRENRNSSGLSYSDLPPEAKQICDSLCKTIKGYTREKYLTKYAQSK